MTLSAHIAALARRIGFDWYRAKTFVEHAIAFSDDALHVFAGVLLQVLAAAVLRRSLASWLPWLAVALLELANEAVDLWIERWPDFAEQLGEGGKDVLLTLFLPTVLLIVARRWPRVMAGRK